MGRASSPLEFEQSDIALARTALRDALGRPIPARGPLRVWLDDDLEDRRAPEGWVHVISAREACLLLQTGRVTELSLDHDIGSSEAPGGEERFGSGHQVIDWLDEMMGAHQENYWPEMIQLHTANPAQRDAMARAILAAQRNHSLDVREQARCGTKRIFLIGGEPE